MDTHKNPNNLQPPTSTHRRSSSHDRRRRIHLNCSNATTTKNLDDHDKNPTFSLEQYSTPPPRVAAEEEENGRERLKRHRVEMAGRVWIPDIWGQEDLLTDWIDCTVFDSSLGNKSIMSARTALVQEASSTLRLENRC